MIGQKGVPSAYGGIETHVTELATRLVREGFAVVAYGRNWYSALNGNSHADRYNGIRIILLPSIRTKHLDAISHTLLATLHAIFLVRPTIYHFHGVGPSLLAWLPKIFAPKARVITTFHCIDRQHTKWNAFARFMLYLGEKACLTFADECIVVSRTLQEYALKEYGRFAAYIPNGITPRRTTADTLLLNPFNLQSYHYVAMVSRLVPHKGAHTLVAAWQKARELNPTVMRDLKLAIVGDSAFTDSYVQSLKIQAINDQSIIFTGYQNGATLEALFTGARFTINPSTSEGLPIAVLEAMSYGKAVIASDIPAHLEIVSDYGMPFATGNVDDLAAKIVDLAADPMKAASLGHLARTFVEQDYNWDDIALQTVAVYSKPQLAAAAILATE